MRRIRLLPYLFFLIGSCYGYGQDKLIEHLVKKGDNVYRLSLKYNVSVEDIYNLNPEARSLIKVGETLKIGVVNSKKKKSLNDNKHVVAKGETKFGLSQKYGISIARLETLNPFIKSGLQAGHVLDLSPIKQDKSLNSDSLNTEANTHTVSKGETLWGLSKQYNVKLEDLIEVNTSQLGKFLKIGQQLVIPKNTINSKNQYLVKKGDTKYGLSKRFNLTITELEELNPQIKDMLRAGVTIETSRPQKIIPTTDENIVTIAIKEPDSLRRYYIVKKGETLYRISKNLNLSEKKLKMLNPGLSSNISIGDTIWFNKATDDIKPVVRTESTKLKTKFLINWYSDISSTNQEFIKSFSTGVEKAIDSLKTTYESLAVTFVNKSSLTKLPKTTEDVHYSIQPHLADGLNSEEKSSYTVYKHNSGYIDSLTIEMLPSQTKMEASMLSYLRQNSSNVVCLYDKNSSFHTKDEQIKHNDLSFIKISNRGTFNSNDLIEALQPKTKNYIIIESSEFSVYLSASSILLKQSSEYDIQLVVLNKASIPSKDQISYNRFRILKLIYPMPYNPNFLSSNNIFTHRGFLEASELINRLIKYNLQEFPSVITTRLGTTFKFEGKETLINTAVGIYGFSESEDSKLIRIIK